MRRATKIQAAGSFDASGAIDRVVLDADERHRRRIVLTGEHGTKFLLDLDRAVALKDGDGLVLDDGAIVSVAGRPEPLVEIEAKSPLDLVRLAWHLGNRHTQVEIVGGKLAPIEAPFEPEAGAHGHAQGEHAHDHAPADHEHGP